VKRCDATARRIDRSVMSGLSHAQAREHRGVPVEVGARDGSQRHTRVNGGRTDPRTTRPPRTDRVGVDWPTPSRRDAEGGARLSLWWAPLDVSATTMEDLSGCISPAELRHAERCNHPRVRARFLAARGWLRHLLAVELSCAPLEVPIVTDGRGKPRIGSSDLTFSAARTADVALFAISWSMELGVDIEAVRPAAEIDGIVRRMMSPAEQRALKSLSSSARRVAFFDCWTRKEAYGKAIGAGLAYPLREIDLWRVGSGPVTVSGCRVHQVDAGPRFAAAVAGADTGDWLPPAPRRAGIGSRDRTYPSAARQELCPGTVTGVTQ
jgi:4'-phosphopantetheinyl transferase